MIPSRTTFQMAVGASTHVMQRRMVAVLAPLKVVVETAQRGDQPAADWQRPGGHQLMKLARISRATDKKGSQLERLLRVRQG